MFDLIKMIVKVRYWTLALIITSFFLVSSFVIYLIEPENFPNPFIGFWWVMTTVTTVGYGDYVPETIPGQLFGLFLYIIGIGLVGVGLGKVVEAFGIYRRLKEEGRLNFNGHDHFVLVGWSQRAEKTANEILLAREDAIIVLIDTIDKIPFEHSRFHFIQGDATDRSVLDKAHVSQASAVLVFAPDQILDPSFTDGKTLLIASTIESYATEKSKDIYTIVEISKERHIPNFKHANVEAFVLSSEAFSDLMAKSALQKGSTSLFMKLLSADQGDNIWEIKKKPSWKTYNDAFEALKEMGANLLADHQDFGITRRLDEEIPFDAKLYVICDQQTYEKLR
ncbi:potassium channel family protein [Desertibacillus haloalkaliphilus]|nr:potassium channel family protein [Desertibacillus haloalkaliphilus]MBU8906855.1 potassium channel family protein [Desertibacillus haloalkaliphilus]